MTDSSTPDSEIIDVEAIHPGVVRVRTANNVTYVKYASETEIERTRDHIEKWSQLDKETIFQPPVVTAYHAPQVAIIEGKIESTSYPERKFRLETKAHPADAVPIYSEDGQTLLTALKGEKIRAAEVNQLFAEHKLMKRMNIAHGDLMANGLIGRNDEGKLKIYLFDFDPMSLNPGQSDLRTLTSLINTWSALGLIDSRNTQKSANNQTLE